MSNLNDVTLIGRISRKDDLRQTQTGKDVLNFGLAVNRSYKDDEADFFNVTAWQKTAEIVSQYKNVGDLIVVKGQLRTDKYEKDGQTRTSTYVVADRVVFLPSKNDNAGGGGGEETATENESVPF